jgi:hypothetical protein
VALGNAVNTIAAGQGEIGLPASIRATFQGTRRYLPRATSTEL